jgi:hypothetical protein
MTVTPTPGSITSNSLVLTNPTVGVMTNLTLNFVQQHAIP